MNLTDEQINENFQKFLSLLEDAIKDREGANFEGLKNKLINSDFSTAPASTKYHCSFKGGLVVHCLNVYYNIMGLIKVKNLEDKVSASSAALVALMHDFSKMNFYEVSYRNKKVYSNYGTKKDENGKFDWISEQSFVTKEQCDRFIFGNHEETSEFMLRSYVPLTVEESAAILSHHGGMGYDSTQQTAPIVMNRYILASLLHIADMLATYLDEGYDN